MNPNPRTPKCQEGSPGKGTGGLALPPLPLRPLAAASSGSCWQYWLLTVLPKGPLGAGQAPGSHKGPAEGAWADNPDRHPAASSCPPPQAQWPQQPTADRCPPHGRCPEWGSGPPALRHVLLGTQGPFPKVRTNHGGSSPSARTAQGLETAPAERGADGCAASPSRRSERPWGWRSPGGSHTLLWGSATRLGRRLGPRPRSCRLFRGCSKDQSNYILLFRTADCNLINNTSLGSGRILEGKHHDPTW